MLSYFAVMNEILLFLLENSEFVFICFVKLVIYGSGIVNLVLVEGDNSPCGKIMFFLPVLYGCVGWYVP